MDHVDFKGRNVMMGAPRDWDPAKHGPCGALPVRRAVAQDMAVMESYWKPTETDLANLLAGHGVKLSIFGAVHPPVMLSVEEVP